MSDQPNGQRVLVVEDESNIASFVAMYLKKAGFGVTVAANGEEALRRAKTDSPAIVLLDLNLPDVDGIDVCRELRQSSDVPILMLTARDDDVDKIIGLEVGADDYLTKPFNPRELVARVKSILRRSASSSRRLSDTVICMSITGVERPRSPEQRCSSHRRSSTYSGSFSTTEDSY